LGVVAFLTDFADQAVLLPLAFIVAGCLAISGWWRGAVAWLLGIGATLAAMLFLKIGFIACGPDDILRSPSGHTAAAAVVCGGLMAVLGDDRRLAVPAAVLAALLIGISRFALGAHTPLEILVGAATGIAGAWLVVRFAGPIPKFRRNRIVIAALLVVVLLHGMHMPAEAHIRGLAERVAQYLPACRVS
jgi:membrane-associated phospholipid phosphatase